MIAVSLTASSVFNLIGRPQPDKVAASLSCFPVSFSALCLWGVLGSLRSEDGDGRENVAEKVNSRSFNLHRGYSKSLTLSNVGELSKS